MSQICDSSHPVGHHSELVLRNLQWEPQDWATFSQKQTTAGELEERNWVAHPLLSLTRGTTTGVRHSGCTLLTQAVRQGTNRPLLLYQDFHVLLLKSDCICCLPGTKANGSRECA